MDLGTLIGFVFGFFCILMACFIAVGMVISDMIGYADLPSVFVVFGGVISSIMIAFPLSKIMAALKAVRTTFSPPQLDPASAIRDIISLANLARKEGILALEEAARTMDDAFLQKGIMLIVDGTDPELTRSIMETELSYIEERHKTSKSMWDNIAQYAPSWGMVGTVVGLIAMLQNLEDASTIGPKMAVAIVTTFYGAIIANLIAIPISNKLKVYSAEEILMKEVLIEGMLSIQAGENPRIIEEKLKSFLSPAVRDAMGTGEGGSQAGE